MFASERYQNLIRLYRMVRPYLHLMRLHQPAGTWLVMIPSLWAFVLAAKQTLPFITFLVIIAGAIIVRSLGCVINDIVDYKIDREVERTKQRPLASGAISMFQAAILAIFLAFIALFLLMQLNVLTRVLGFLVVFLIIAYPFMKRFTYWPQIFLGITFNWGALMAWTAVTGSLSTTAFVCYFAAVLWTLGYDTIYAHQDKDDDAVIGIHSSALALGSHTKIFLSGVYVLMLFLLWLAGAMQSLGLLYYITLIIAAFQLAWQILDVDLQSAIDCSRKFRSNVYLGWIVFVGLALGVWI
jgi:4-hydroxybenzoate polyprenyltransferase